MKTPTGFRMKFKNLPTGTLYTCYESFTHKGGKVSTEKLWLFLPHDGERTFVGLCSEMTADEALAIVER